MRKIYLLLAFVTTNILLQAQTTPLVNFTFAVDAPPNTVKFATTSQILGEGTKKAFWTFGDGTAAVTGGYDGTSHHYASAGSYQACLKIYRYSSSSNDSALIGSACKSVTFQQQVTCTARFEWAAGDRVVKFYGVGSSNQSIVQVCWNFGDNHDTCITANSATNALNASHTYAQGGTYNACIRIKYEG